MILFINNAGTITNSLPEEVYQGSANANSIYVVAPFAHNLTATVAYRLPNGIVTSPQNLRYTGEIEGFTDDKGNTFYGWECSLPNDVTSYYGPVMAQITFYATGRTLCTAAFTFTVARGVVADLPDTPTDDVYDQILETISQIQSDLGNGYYTARAVFAWNASYKYGANELVYYPYGEYGVYVRSTQANNTTQPLDENGAVNAGWEIVVDFNAVMNALEDAQQAAKDAADSATAAQASEEAAEAAEEGAKTAETNAAESASAAENSATAAATSAEAAAGSASAASGSASQAAQSATQSAQSATEAKTSEEAAEAAEAGANASATAAASSAEASAASAAAAKASEQTVAESAANAAASEQNAAESEANAATSAQNAQNSAEQAAQSTSGAATSATLSMSWAIGGTGTREGEDTDNSKYYA